MRREQTKDRRISLAIFAFAVAATIAYAGMYRSPCVESIIETKWGQCPEWTTPEVEPVSGATICSCSKGGK